MLQSPRGHNLVGAAALQVATLVKADWLFLLTDVDGLYTANPATHPEALHIPEVHDITKLQVGFLRFLYTLRQMSGSVPTKKSVRCDNKTSVQESAQELLMGLHK